MLYLIVKSIAFSLFKLILSMKIVGKRNIPRDGGVLFVANHLSYLDPIIVGAASPRVLNYLARADLFSIPLFSQLIRGLNAIPLKRDRFDRSSLMKCTNILKDGKALLLFPEGTRGIDGKLGEGKLGAGMIAYYSKKPVIPTYIVGSGKVLPRGKFIPRLKQVCIIFGKPVNLDIQFDPSDKKKQIYEIAVKRIMDALKELQNKYEPAALENNKRIVRNQEIYIENYY